MEWKTYVYKAEFRLEYIPNKKKKKEREKGMSNVLTTLPWNVRRSKMK